MDKPAIEEALLKRTGNLIASRIGFLVLEQDEPLLRKIVAERVRALNLSGAEEYGQWLDSDEDLRHEREELAVLLTTGETYFFRDSGQYALLQDRILPELLERRKALHTLYIWCAACSSGEEAYSLAILLDELMADQSQWNIQVLGTDINHQAIEKARQGIYTEWSFRNMSAERRQRYFHRRKNTWVLDEAIRDRVRFRLGDLVADEFPTASDLHDQDLILCRNTFIYMARPVVSRIADKFTETLAEGGILITGHGELYAHHLGKLRSRVFPEAIVYQKVSEPFFLPAAVPTVVPTAAPPTEIPPALLDSHAAVDQPAAAEIHDTTAVPEMQRAWRYANQGQPDRAANICGDMVAAHPLVAEPHYLLALLAQERGDFAEAKDLLKKVIYLDPSLIAAYLDLGDLYAREGYPARAGKMRATARDLLKTLPGDEQVKLYGASTVNTVMQYVEHLLSAHV
ncbi:MAG: chemotaxis protein CheR [Proteobacteria bacterium]|nr:chemotaxis protein CheR [Pseudomonadota bacterium]